MAKKNEADGLYFVNCIRGLPIFPLGEPDPTKRYSLKPIKQGRHAAVESEPPEAIVDDIADATTAEYMQAESGSKSVSEDDEVARLIHEQEAERGAERAA